MQNEVPNFALNGLSKTAFNTRNELSYMNKTSSYRGCHYTKNMSDTV